MKHLSFVAIACLVSLGSIASAAPYNGSASDKPLNHQTVQRRTYRSYSYAPRTTQSQQAAPAQATPAPAVAQPAQPSQPQQMAQSAPRRAYRSYSYQPYTQFSNPWNEPSWRGLGKNGDHYYSRADNKVFSRGGQGW